MLSTTKIQPWQIITSTGILYYSVSLSLCLSLSLSLSLSLTHTHTHSHTHTQSDQLVVVWLTCGVKQCADRALGWGEWHCTLTCRLSGSDRALG